MMRKSASCPSFGRLRPRAIITAQAPAQLDIAPFVPAANTVTCIVYQQPPPQPLGQEDDVRAYAACLATPPDPVAEDAEGVAVHHQLPRTRSNQELESWLSRVRRLYRLFLVQHRVRSRKR